jgi:PAS domain S-box-containing protein
MPVKLAVLAVLTILLMILTWGSLINNTQVIFTHLYYIPIILGSYWFGRKGVLYATGLAAMYFCAVLVFSITDSHIILAAAARALSFIAISLVIAILSLVIHRQKEMVVESEERFRGVWENIQAGVILVDAETHTIIAANPEAVRMTGFTEEEMNGHLCHKFICPAEKGRCPISDLGLTVDHAERVLLARDGKQVPVLKTVTTLTIGNRKCLIESFIDITPVKEAQLALLAYVREATLRTRNPVEQVRDNLREIKETLMAGEITPEVAATTLSVQEKHMDDILHNLQELEQAVAEKRTEIPDALREYGVEITRSQEDEVKEDLLAYALAKLDEPLSKWKKITPDELISGGNFFAGVHFHLPDKDR